ncbi:type IV pilus assembly protein PilA [Planococcus glaciei]|uniref:prepilin-type N-terminal cleavage/methylation domain-containing protein n=1 Tax=Planococcus glaciei TaxID=459472 RepID=UPI00088279E5|nr:prepilin-type N-terminal cleavage/methylation domain-containing protein [Planococcus glaciei]SDI41303.1 type IV pilus assembly protein PilA [Planococcus glaciei]
MKKFLQKKLKEQKGMTLIELLAVIVIIAIIAAIAIPAIGNIIENSRVGAAKSDALSAFAGAELYLADNPSATSVTLAQLEDGYIDDAGTLDSFTYTPAAGSTVASFEGASKVSGGIEIAYAAGTTKAMVSALPNNSETGDGGTITITGR